MNKKAHEILIKASLFHKWSEVWTKPKPGRASLSWYDKCHVTNTVLDSADQSVSL